jgi:hypothetical protein
VYVSTRWAFAVASAGSRMSCGLQIVVWGDCTHLCISLAPLCTKNVLASSARLTQGEICSALETIGSGVLHAEAVVTALRGHDA